MKKGLVYCEILSLLEATILTPADAAELKKRIDARTMIVDPEPCVLDDLLPPLPHSHE